MILFFRIAIDLESYFKDYIFPKDIATINDISDEVEIFVFLNVKVEYYLEEKDIEIKTGTDKERDG